jgi:large subunit ribosomal protein L7/L12
MRIPALVLAVFAVLTCAGHAADDIERFSVRLSSTGDSKVEVLKELREMGLGLREAKDIVEDTPRTLVQGVTKDIAEPMKSRLEKAGAKVDIIAANSGAASSDAPASVSPPPTEVKIERLDPASGPFYVRIDAGLRTLPSESAAETGKLDENDDIKVLGATPSTRLQPADNERWWKVERKTGESGFVLGKYLMSAEIKKEKENILAKITPLQDLMSKPMSAQGPHVRMISGMYAAGGCEKEPERLRGESRRGGGQGRVSRNARTGSSKVADQRKQSLAQEHDVSVDRWRQSLSHRSLEPG